MRKTGNSWIQVELTTRCNLKCQYCERTIVDMESKDVSPKIRDGLLEFLCEKYKANKVLFQGFGETFLYPEFNVFITKLRKIRKDMSIQIVSNGMINNQNVMIILKNVDVLYISFDSINDNYWENVRCGGNKDRILKNIAEFKKNNPELRIVINSVVNNKNITEMKDVIQTLKKIGIKEFQIIPEINIESIDNSSCAENKIRQMITKLKEEYEDIIIYSSLGQNPLNDCLWYDFGFYVTIDGTLTPCCMQSTVDEDTHVIGNILDSDVIEKITFYRENLEEVKRGNACRECKKIKFNETWNSVDRHPLT